MLRTHYFVIINYQKKKRKKIFLEICCPSVDYGNLNKNDLLLCMSLLSQYSTATHTNVNSHSGVLSGTKTQYNHRERYILFYILSKT